jgi:hypothetical protein
MAKIDARSTVFTRGLNAYGFFTLNTVHGVHARCAVYKRIASHGMFGVHSRASAHVR